MHLYFSIMVILCFHLTLNRKQLHVPIPLVFSLLIWYLWFETVAIKLCVRSFNFALRVCNSVNLRKNKLFFVSLFSFCAGLHHKVDAAKPAEEVFSAINLIFANAKSKDVVMFLWTRHYHRYQCTTSGLPNTNSSQLTTVALIAWGVWFGASIDIKTIDGSRWHGRPVKLMER